MRPGLPSATALLVAASVARRGAPHGLPPVAQRFAVQALRLAAGRGSALGMLAGHHVGRMLLGALEALLLPGLADHHCARKAWLWGRLLRHVRDRPVLWVGVGYDGLGRALVEHVAQARVIETDHPATLQQRRAIAADAAIDMQAIELPGQFPALVHRCAATPLTLVCEGVLMYLPPRPLLRALMRLAALPAPPRLMFSVLDAERSGGRGFGRERGRVRRWLEHHGEPFRWRASPDVVLRCLSAAGYTATGFWNGSGFGEYMVEAQWSGPARTGRRP